MIFRLKNVIQNRNVKTAVSMQLKSYCPTIVQKNLTDHVKHTPTTQAPQKHKYPGTMT